MKTQKIIRALKADARKGLCDGKLCKIGGKNPVGCFMGIILLTLGYKVKQLLNGTFSEGLDNSEGADVEARQKLLEVYGMTSQNITDAINLNDSIPSGSYFIENEDGSEDHVHSNITPFERLGIVIEFLKAGALDD